MNESIFRAYDIRGDCPSQINETVAYVIGRAIATFLKSKKIIVGRDCRNNSKELTTALINGIIEQGTNVVDIGLCSTPMAIFTAKKTDTIIVTASHLPADKNGFKIFKKGVIPVGIETGLLKIKKLFEKNKFLNSKNKGKIQSADYAEKYAEHVLKFAKNVQKLKIVIDAGNGMAGYTTPYIFNKLPCKIIKLFFKLNGNFQNRNPNPMNTGAETILCETVKRERADFGAAYDVDCDRILFVDEKGQIVPTDIILAFLAQHLLGRKKENVVYELTCSKIIPETIKSLGGNPIISKVGHTFIEQMMRKKKAIFGGERSGHYFYRDNFFGDSGDITLMLLISFLSKTNKKLSELTVQFKKYHDVQKTFPAKNKEKVIKKLEILYKKQKINKIDGITIEFSDWWFNLRASNTEPTVKLTIESKNKSILAEKIKQLSAIVTKYSQYA